MQEGPPRGALLRPSLMHFYSGAPMHFVSGVDTRWRKGAPIASHVLLSASPSYFRPDSPEASGTWDATQLEAWLTENLAWLRSRWPNQVACWRLDLDESTPHLDVFIAPINRYKTRGGREIAEVSHRSAFGNGRQSFARLQDEYAKAMQGLGLSRGRPRTATRAHHVNPAAFRRQLALDVRRQRAMTIGLAGLLRGDIRALSIAKSGIMKASFASRVPAGARPRFLSLIQPAGGYLIAFEKKMVRAVQRTTDAMVEFVVTDAETDRRAAAETLIEANGILDEMSRLGLYGPAGSRSRLQELVLELVR